MELGIRLWDQILTFLYAIVFGLLAGGLYELFRILRAFTGGGTVRVLVEDVLYWLILSFAMYAFFLLFTEGAVRGYILLGAAAGFFVYLSTVGRLFALAYHKAIRPLRRKLWHPKRKIPSKLTIFQKK